MKIKFNRSVIRTTYEEVEAEVLEEFHLPMWARNMDCGDACAGCLNVMGPTDFLVPYESDLVVVRTLESNFCYHKSCWEKLKEEK